MTGAESDVATLVRIKIAREATLAARQSWEDRRFRLMTPNQFLSGARSRWPAYMALTRALVADYQRRSKDLGIRVEIEELIRLRAWLPELMIHVARDDRELATRLIFSMGSDGRTFCRIQQTKGVEAGKPQPRRAADPDVRA